MTTEPDLSTATRYQLDVIAPRLADVVRHTGGWLFDHVMAGWDVTALLPECSDPRPLHILGVQVATVNNEPEKDCAPIASTVAVCETIYREQAGIRRRLDHAVEHGSKVVLWPGDPVAHTVPAVGQVRHRLTRAACVFKAEALQALTGRRATVPSDWSEYFQCLTCSAAAPSPERGFVSAQSPRRAFDRCPSSPPPSSAATRGTDPKAPTREARNARNASLSDTTTKKEHLLMNRYGRSATNERRSTTEDWQSIR